MIDCIVRNALLALLLAAPFAAAAQEAANCPCPPPEPPPPLWTGSLGLSYLSTSGNTDTESLGLSAQWSRQPTPWGLELAAAATRAESEGVETTERLFGTIRGKRALDERWDLFAGLSHERNEFAGFDARSILEAGVVYRALSGPEHTLSFDAGATWTREEAVDGSEDDWPGALLGLTYAWQISEGARLGQRLLWFPNLDRGDDWRLHSETALEAALASAWALRVACLWQRDAEPPPGFETTDRSTAVSLVWKR
jgi:putative salt-induced outer membrane protein